MLISILSLSGSLSFALTGALTGSLTGALPYLLILVVSFGAATLLPLSSELLLVAQIKSGAGSASGLLMAAIIGNTAGSVVNWGLGMYMRHFEGRRWFPFKPADIDKASTRFQRYGVWTLLLAWVPLMGDPLTFVAGVMRVPFTVFLPLVAMGKAARYMVLVWSL